MEEKKPYIDEECRFYGGESANPFEEGSNEALAWDIESSFSYEVSLMDSGHLLDKAMEVASVDGVEVAEGDTMSFIAKAFFYYLYVRKHQGATLTGFESWYRKLYR